MLYKKSGQKAVIGGGGIGGRGAAPGLAKRGCEITVLEQTDKFGEFSAGIQIGSNRFTPWIISALATSGASVRSIVMR